MNLITKSARKETRRISGGERHLSVLKTQGNRKARHQSNQAVRLVAIGVMDADDTDFEPDFTIDGRDVSLPMYTPITFPKMAEKLPVGTLGVARVEHFTVSEEDSKFTSIRAVLNRDEYVPAGTYARLFVDRTLMMSDTSMEQRSNYRVVREARGHVFIAGLGLGMILHPILEKPEVTKVTVVEKYADVIKLVGPTLPQEKLEMVEADVLTWKPAKGTKYEVVYHDIWPTISEDNLEEMTFLHRRFSRFLTPGGWQDSWKREALRAQRARSKRRHDYGW